MVSSSTTCAALRVRAGWKIYRRLKSHHDLLVQVSWQDMGHELGILHKMLEG